MRRLVLKNIPTSGLDSMQECLCRPCLVRLSRVLVYMTATHHHSLTNKKMQACFEDQFVDEFKIQAGHIEQRVGYCTFHPACHATRHIVSAHSGQSTGGDPIQEPRLSLAIPTISHAKDYHVRKYI